jgi:rubrerythrin
LEGKSGKKFGVEIKKKNGRKKKLKIFIFFLICSCLIFFVLERSGKPSTMSARGGGRGGIVASHVVRTEKNHKFVAAHVAGRAALRAAQRVSWMRMDIEMEICKLQEQLKELNEDTAVETTEEYDYIMKRFMQLENQSNEKATNETNKAAKGTNKTEAFTCGICFAKQPLSTLRVLVPCGHGFCATCISALDANTRAQGQNICFCPNCRAPINSGLQAFL